MFYKEMVIAMLLMGAGAVSGVAADPYPRVQVVIVMGFDEESDKALLTTWRVAQRLLDKYGVWVEIIPVNTWINDPMRLMTPDLPRIEINGKLMFIGRAPEEDELEEKILSSMSAPVLRGAEGVVYAALYRNDKLFSDVAIEA